MQITIYTIKDCPFCKAEKDFLTAHNTPFTEKNVEEHREFLSEMLELSDKFAGVPFTMVVKDDGTKIPLKGFTESEFMEALGLKADMPAVAPAPMTDQNMPTPLTQPVPEVPITQPAPASAMPEPAVQEAQAGVTLPPMPEEKPVVPAADPMPAAPISVPAMPVPPATPAMPAEPMEPVSSMEPPTVPQNEDLKDVLNNLSTMSGVITEPSTPPVEPTPAMPEPVASAPIEPMPQTPLNTPPANTPPTIPDLPKDTTI